MNEHTSLQKYISHTLFSMFLWCVRDEWRQGQTAILTQILLLPIAALLPHLGWGCSTGVAESHSPQSASWFSLWHSCLQLNSTAANICLYSFIIPTCFRLFTQVHLLIDSSVKGQYITHAIPCSFVFYNRRCHLSQILHLHKSLH